MVSLALLLVTFIRPIIYIVNITKPSKMIIAGMIQFAIVDLPPKEFSFRPRFGNKADPAPL